MTKPGRKKGDPHKLPYASEFYIEIKNAVRTRLITSPYADSIPLCVVSNEPVFYVPAWRPRCEGHIATQMGMIVYYDTHICEYHMAEFDTSIGG